jgi:hypothetical protein
MSNGVGKIRLHPYKWTDKIRIVLQGNTVSSCMGEVVRQRCRSRKPHVTLGRLWEHGRCRQRISSQAIAKQCPHAGMGGEGMEEVNQITSLRNK